MPNIDREYDRAHQILRAWQTLAPNDRLGGRDRAWLEAVMGKCTAVRNQIRALEAELEGLRSVRRTHDTEVVAVSKTVVWATSSDSRHGVNSPLLRAMGYITRSQRAKPGPKRGSRRKAAPRARLGGSAGI